MTRFDPAMMPGLDELMDALNKHDGYEGWYSQALVSESRSRSEKVFIKRLGDMGVPYKRIFEINLERKRAGRADAKKK